jgi:NAD(P)-dependent dehydrogenase (short-subunit alcohol dehydrogenase family)
VHHLVKSGLKQLAFALADKLRQSRVAVVAVTPGFLRSESTLDHVKVTEATRRDAAKKDPTCLASETPLFVGRGIAALAADAALIEHSGELVASWELGRRYGVTELTRVLACCTSAPLNPC